MTYPMPDVTQPTPQPKARRRWPWVVGAGVLLLIGVAAVTGGGDDTATRVADVVTTGPAAPSGEGAGLAPKAPAEKAPAPAAPAPVQDDPLSDGVWSASQLTPSTAYGTTSVTARVTNTGDTTRTAMLTLTAFDPAGVMVGTATGSTTDVEAGGTATVQFFSMDELPGDPAGWSWELQVDADF